jgi:hypothetical protein
VQDGVLALDDPIARWLPEAASPRVLVAPDAPLDRTTTARRPITVRHLLTMTSGWGAVLEETPLQKAMLEQKVYPGPLTPPMSGDEFVARVAELPLAFPQAALTHRPGPDGLDITRSARRRIRPPTSFEELSSGLFSAPDLLRFFGLMADGGALILTQGSVAALTVPSRRPTPPGLPSSVGPLVGLATGVDVA